MLACKTQTNILNSNNISALDFLAFVALILVFSSYFQSAGTCLLCVKDDVVSK